MSNYRTNPIELVSDPLIEQVAALAERREPIDMGNRRPRAPFVSRGDKSGTDALEKRLWRATGIDPAASGAGTWYRDIGGGMGAALNAAAGMDAYTLSDRGTWLSFRNKGPLVVLLEGDALLVNRYDVILLNPEKAPSTKTSIGKALRAMVAIVRGTGGNRGIYDRR